MRSCATRDYIATGSMLWGKENVARLICLAEEGYSVAEIADQMGCTTSSVYSALQKYTFGLRVIRHQAAIKRNRSK